MKQILLMRHAKAGWENPLLQDFDRPLTERGVKDAFAMGEFIRKSAYLPEMIISSPAKRAKQTSTFCMKGASLKEELITWNRGFYYGTELDYLEAIQNALDDFEQIMLIGHNPLIESTAEKLAGDNNVTSIKMSTSMVVYLESPATSWKEIQAGNCRIKWIMSPKKINE